MTMMSMAATPLPPLPPPPPLLLPTSAASPGRLFSLSSTPLSLLPSRHRRNTTTTTTLSHSKSISSPSLSSILNNHFFFPNPTRSEVFATSASPKNRRGEKKVENVSDEENDGWDDEEGEEEEGGDEMPFEEMRRWMRNKPAGFGEGKTYDTVVEDRLLEELEQSRRAQLANIAKLKDGGAIGGGKAKKQEMQQPKAIEVIPSGTRVRIERLPRKKNVHRDLQLAFKGFPGIVNISPAVMGNNKTRDPICKGFAFVDLESEAAANRFVQTYSKQSVLFGKVQKQITCDVVNPVHSSNSDSEQFNGNTGAFTPRLQLTFSEKEAHIKSDVVTTWDSQERASEGSDSIDNNEECTTVSDGKDDAPSSSQPEDTNMDNGSSNTTFQNNEETASLRNVKDLGLEESTLLMQKQKQKVQAASKRKIVKTKSSKDPKLSMPASAIRLKVKERAVLTGVFSKYGGKAPPALSKER